MIAISGGNSIDAIDFYGKVMFGFLVVLGYSVRLIFWPRTPAKLRSFVRAAMTAILATSVIVSAISLVLIFLISEPVHGMALPKTFSVFSLLCLPLTFLWLFRYRKEGL